jgi:hypothetical protein
MKQWFDSTIDDSGWEMGRLKKRVPLGRKYDRRGRRHRVIQPNTPNSGDTKGSRIYVKGTVGQVKRELRLAGITVKKVRHSGFDGIVEVVYTQQHGRRGPSGLYFTPGSWHRLTSVWSLK